MGCNEHMPMHARVVEHSAQIPCLGYYGMLERVVLTMRQYSSALAFSSTRQSLPMTSVVAFHEYETV